MDENQINSFLEHLLSKKRAIPSNYFRGCFSSDEILNNKELKPNFKKHETFGFIINTTKRNEDRFGHWLAIQIRVKKASVKLLFFDSFALSYKFYVGGINEYVNRVRLECFENRVGYYFESLGKAVQHPHSYTCGPHVCYFISNCINTSIKTLYNKFEKNSKKKNDEVVLRFVRNNWITNYCNQPPPKKNSLNFPKRGIHFCPVRTYGDHRCLANCRCCNNISSSDDE